MHRLLALLCVGCVAPDAVADRAGPERDPGDDPGTDLDTADPSDDTDGGPDDTGALPDDTGGPDEPCVHDDDPERSMAWAPLLGRLQQQRCLSEADQDAAIAFIDTFFDEGRVWCDAVYRLSSSDGRFFTGVPEMVREHASVPDVAITPDDAHVLVFNDLRPGLFADTLRTDPARFWRQGLLGVGGLGMAMDRGEGFVDVALDLALPLLALVVDPDLALRPAGDYRLVSFHVPFLELDGVEWDPYKTGSPHDYFRAVSPRFGSYPTAGHVISSETGEHGGADPTVLDLPDGEIFFLGDFTRSLLGWTAPNAQYPAFGTLPDVSPGLLASAPKAVVAPDGTYRLYYVDQLTGTLQLATSLDGHEWVNGGPATDLYMVNSPAVARASDGTWWLYFNRKDEACMAGTQAG